MSETPFQGERLAGILASVDAKTVYLRFNPLVFDFTDSESPVYVEAFTGQDSHFSLRLTQDNIRLVLSMLQLSIFSKDRKIIVWDWKSFASYVKHITSSDLSVDCSIIDLKVIESYCGIKHKSPEGLTEALNRLRNLVASGMWREVETVYKTVHLPLITAVLPAIETSGIIDPDRESLVYAHYEVDGQENGRLRCEDAFRKGFMPHALKPEKRDVLKPRSQEELFMLFDFKGMEVYMLAWMSKDPLLTRLCRESDVYSELFRVLTDREPSGRDDRDFAKKTFLPHIYGQSAHSLSQRCGVAMDVAERVVERIRSSFPTALMFVADYERQARETGQAKDIFGKRRANFEKGREYLARNFCVQAPAATVCSEKLVSLHFALKGMADISYTCHDGYAVYATKDNWRQVFASGYEVLTGESALCPGLRLKVACRAGRNLNGLKPLSRKG